MGNLLSYKSLTYDVENINGKNDYDDTYLSLDPSCSSHHFYLSTENYLNKYGPVTLKNNSLTQEIKQEIINMLTQDDNLEYYFIIASIRRKYNVHPVAILNFIIFEVQLTDKSQVSSSWHSWILACIKNDKNNSRKTDVTLLSGSLKVCALIDVTTSTEIIEKYCNILNQKRTYSDVNNITNVFNSQVRYTPPTRFLKNRTNLKHLSKNLSKNLISKNLNKNLSNLSIINNN